MDSLLKTEALRRTHLCSGRSKKLLWGTKHKPWWHPSCYIYQTKTSSTNTSRQCIEMYILWLRCNVVVDNDHVLWPRFQIEWDSFKGKSVARGNATERGSCRRPQSVLRSVHGRGASAMQEASFLPGFPLDLEACFPCCLLETRASNSTTWLCSLFRAPQGKWQPPTRTWTTAIHPTDW